MNNFSLGPDWVMLGADWEGDRVIVIASQDLSEAELNSELKAPEFLPFLSGPLESAKLYTTMTCVMGKYTIAIGPDYRSAITNLMERWQPKESKSKLNKAGPPEISDGTE